MRGVMSYLPLSYLLGEVSRDILFEDILVTPPNLEPLDLEEVKKQRRFSATTLDTRFDVWISAARQQFEEEAGLQLMLATRLCMGETFPIQSAITVKRAPVQSIVSVEYIGSDGITVVAMDPEDYEMFPSTPTKGVYPSPGGVRLAQGAAWPVGVDRPGGVRVTYTAGFGSAPGDVPELIAHALMMYVGDFHRWSENQTEKSVTTTPIGSLMIRRHAAYMMSDPRRMTRW